MSERFNLRAGTVIHTVRANIGDAWPIDPPFVVPEDGYYTARVDLSNGTATVERVDALNRWAAFTDDELAGMLDTWSHYTNDRDGHLQFEVEAELERRKSP